MTCQVYGAALSIVRDGYQVRAFLMVNLRNDSVLAALPASAMRAGEEQEASVN